MSAGLDLVKIRPAVAEQSRRKIKTTTPTERVVKHKTSLSVTATDAV